MMNGLALTVLSYLATSMAAPEDYRCVDHTTVVSILSDRFKDVGNTSSLTASSGSGTAIVKDRLRYSIKAVSFNSPGMDFSPCLLNDGLVFVSTRSKKGSVPSGHDSFLNLFYARESEDGSFSEPEPLNDANISSYHEGPVSFYQKGTKMVFTRNSFIKNSKVRDGAVNPLELAQAEKTSGGKWSEAVALSFAGREYSVAHPAMNEEGTILYFSSNMPGTLGHSDLFVSHFENGTWSTPENLGSSINTSGQELFPFVYKDSLLFFSSNGHAGEGGLDIFYCQLKDPGKIIRMESPVNSTADDFGIYVEQGAASGFFSSNREGGAGEDDIYYFEEIQPYAEIQVYDSVTRTFIPNALLTLTDESGSDRKIRSDLSGKAGFRLSPFRQYRSSVSAPGYQSRAIEIKPAMWALDQKAPLRIYMQPLRYAEAGTLSSGVRTRDRTGLTNVVSFSSSPLDVDLVSESASLPRDAPTLEIPDSVSSEAVSVIVVEIINNLPAILIVKNDSIYELKNVSASSLQNNDLNLRIDVPLGAKRNVYEEVIRKQILVQGFDIGGFLLIRSFFFDSGKAWVRNDACAQLDKIIEVMMSQPVLDLQMTFHSDSRGTEQSNLVLSRERAEEVTAYLVKAGIKASRLVTEFVGEGQLLNECGDLADCDEMLHQINRTAEFKFLIR